MVNRGDHESPSGGEADGAAANAADPAPARTPAAFDFHSILGIADSLPVMVAYCDTAQVYRFCNRPIAEWFERPREEILGRTIREIMGEDAYAIRKPSIEAALAGERQWFAASFNHPTRGPLTTQADYIPQFAADGSVAGITMVVQDVTEQRVAEVSLRESEARFRRIANSAPAPMWVTRSDGSRDFVNEAYLDFFGFAPDEAHLHDWQSAIHPEDRERFIGDYEAGIASGGTFEMVGRLRRADGEWRWMRAVSQPRKDAEGRTIGFTGAASDVTAAKQAELELRRLIEERTAELKDAQDQLRQSQKMEALGQLTGGIAHDFNNLLTVVVGGLDMIAKQVTDDRLLRYAKNALSAAERGARLTGQLLAFSRVQRLEVRPTYVAPLIEDMRPILRNVLGPGITKQFELDPHLMPVMADPTQLEVAVLNLAINARDAMPAGGTLRFATRKVEIGEEQDGELAPGDYVELAITDSGFGMTEEVAARAFEPFFTTKEVGKGTGLGLSMVYGMARQSGGTARIESRPGEGTTVRLYFRRAEEDRAADAERQPTIDQVRPSKKKVSVLVIDDDPDVRGFIVSSLEEFGYGVREAADGQAGLDAYRARRPDVVVIDYVMPGLTGAEVAARMLAVNPTQKLLFVSGYSETEAIRLAAPDAALLAKPFRPQALNSAIAALVAS